MTIISEAYFEKYEILWSKLTTIKHTKELIAGRSKTTPYLFNYSLEYLQVNANSNYVGQQHTENLKSRTKLLCPF